MSDLEETVEVKPKSLAEQVERLQKIQVVIYNMYFDKQVSEDQLHSSLICLARDWIDLDRKQDARDVVSRVTEKYLQDVLPVQMRNDEEFHQTVHELAQALSDGASNPDDSEIDLAILRGPTAQA